MQEKRKIILNTMAGVYILLITVVLPLYMKDGYVRIGDAKYNFYFNASLLLFLCSSLCFLVGAVCLAVKAKGRSIKQNKKQNTAQDIRKNLRWSLLDSMVFLYGCSVILSYCVSEYKETALFGYADWHMGLLTQLLLVWSYFFISRCSAGEGYLWKLMAAGAFIVFAVGVLNRYVYDPLGCFQGIDLEDWNYLNLLSTIGNVNWYCGYVCVALPFLLYFFWSSKGTMRVLWGTGSLIGFVTLFTQGSASGYAGVAAILAVLLVLSAVNREKIIRFLEVLLLFFLTPVLITATISIAPRGLQLPEQATADVIFWKGWGVLALLAGVLLVWCILPEVLAWRKKKGKADGMFEKTGNKAASIKKILSGGILALVLVVLLVFVLCQVSDAFWQRLGGLSVLKVDENWGSGRGVLWRLSLQCFLEENLLQKLFGAGPDCFACIMGEMFDMESEIIVSGQFQGAVFANAHNEWLNTLITCGILGASAYLGIFAAAFIKFCRRADGDSLYVLGAMMIAGYVANNFFSFQQIVAVPVVFVVLGMLENRCREAK